MSKMPNNGGKGRAPPCAGALVRQIDVQQVEALHITHQRESFVPVDAHIHPLRNGILWLDERSRLQVKTLEQRFGRAALHQLTGKPPAMTPALPKFLWLIEHEPDLIAQTAKFLDVHAFLVYHLTGILHTSTASADPLGVFDMVKQNWATDLIEALGLRADQFVECVPPGSIIGQIQASAALVTGLPVGLPVVAGGGDGQCAGLGANAMIGGWSAVDFASADQ
ncbi:MAG: FGGY family carbohydrate kinase [Flavobacterium sp.]